MDRRLLLLRVLAPICVLVGALHLMLGPQADVLLGAQLPPDALADPVLDSQNRFYGVAFCLYGWLLHLCATDIARYRPVLDRMLVVFFAGGLARVVSIAAVGVPTAPVIGLMGVELLLPVIIGLQFRAAGRC